MIFAIVSHLRRGRAQFFYYHTRRVNARHFQGETTMGGTLSYTHIALLALLIIIVIYRMNARADAKQNQLASHTTSATPDVVGPDGERVIVSVGPERRPLPSPHDMVSVTQQSSETVLCECGHYGPSSYSIDAYGMVFTGIDNHRWCPDCLTFMFRQQATRCALCGHVICLGDGVALYGDNDALPYKHVSTKVGDAFVGCMRWDCCPSGGFFAGHWTEEGFKSAFSPTADSLS